MPYYTPPFGQSGEIWSPSLPPRITCLGTKDASGFNIPLFLRAGEGVTGVASLNNATGSITLGGNVGIAVTNSGAAFEVSNAGVISVTGSGGITVGGTSSNVLLSATAGSLPQTGAISLGAFASGVQSTSDSVFTTSPFVLPTAGTYLLTVNWTLPYACFTPTVPTGMWGRMTKNASLTFDLGRTTQVALGNLTVGNQQAAFSQTAVGMITVAAGDSLAYTVNMTESTYVTVAGSAASYSAVRIT